MCGCFTSDISRTLGALIDGNYSTNWVSKITDAVQEKVEAYRDRPIKNWYPIVFIDEAVINIRRGSEDTAESPTSPCGDRRKGLQGSFKFLVGWQ